MHAGRTEREVLAFLSSPRPIIPYLLPCLLYIPCLGYQMTSRKPAATLTRALVSFPALPDPPACGFRAGSYCPRPTVSAMGLLLNCSSHRTTALPDQSTTITTTLLKTASHVPHWTHLPLLQWLQIHLRMQDLNPVALMDGCPIPPTFHPPHPRTSVRPNFKLIPVWGCHILTGPLSAWRCSICSCTFLLVCLWEINGWRLYFIW